MVSSNGQSQYVTALIFSISYLIVPFMLPSNRPNQNFNFSNCDRLETSLRMFNNLRTDPSDQSGSLDGVVNPSMRKKMQNLTINDM